MGFQQLAVASLQEYEEMAVALATDAVQLQQLHREVSDARTSSPYFDTRRL